MHKQTMAKPHEYNPRSIKYYVRLALLADCQWLKGKVAVDVPSGNGVSAAFLKSVGAEVRAFDLFPEYFRQKGLVCEKADVLKGLPMPASSADFVLCQEGIEHFSDQFKALCELNRILKKGGKLLLSTPNYGNLSARLSYFLSEGEKSFSMMPPNEADSVWMSSKEKGSQLYFGHMFLLGIHKLRALAKLSGFRIKKIHPTRKKKGSLLLFPFAYPWIWFANWIAYRKQLRHARKYEKWKIPVYKEIYRLSINPKLLLYTHLLVEFEKELDAEEVPQQLPKPFSGFGIT